MIENIDKNLIEVVGVSKMFKIKRGSRMLLNLLIGSKKDNNILHSLDKVSLTVKKGEILGIIGKNGSGKSTLLRIIGGLMMPNQGYVKLHGTALFLSGFSQGTNPLLTLRQNIFLVGSIMGLRKKDIQNKIDPIVDFAGLRDFLDFEVFKLSSGMITRLDVSIRFHFMQHINPNILLLDEVLSAAGDIEFMKKSVKIIDDLIVSGSTIVLVSHNLDLIAKYCHRVIWLESGRIKDHGDVNRVINIYKNQ